MKRRFPTLPPAGSPARLPALLAPLLAGLAAVQLVLPIGADAPPQGAVGMPRLPALPGEPPVVTAPAALANRDLFAPSVTRPGEMASDPLAGAVISGWIRQGRQQVALVRQADGRVRRIAPGGDIAGWRLAGLDQSGARLTQGGKAMTVAFGQHPRLETAEGSASSEENQ